MSHKEDLIAHLDHVMALVKDDYVVSITSILVGDNDRVIGNNVGEPMPAHGILLMQDMAVEMRDDFVSDPRDPDIRLRSFGPEGGFIVVDDDGNEVEDDYDLVDQDDEVDEEE